MGFTSLHISSPSKIFSEGFLSWLGEYVGIWWVLESDFTVSPHTLLQKSWKTFKRRELERQRKGYWQRACDYCQNKDRSRIIVDDQRMCKSEVSSPQLGWRPCLNLLELDSNSSSISCCSDLQCCFFGVTHDSFQTDLNCHGRSRGWCTMTDDL